MYHVNYILMYFATLTLSFHSGQSQEQEPSQEQKEIGVLAAHISRQLHSGAVVCNVHLVFPGSVGSRTGAVARVAGDNGTGHISHQSHPGAVLCSFHLVFPTCFQAQGQEPSQELMEMTALATYHVNRILALEMSSPKKKQHGHLRKGKLQPLYPVNITGPSITQCRGILSGDSVFSSSLSVPRQHHWSFHHSVQRHSVR